MNPWQKFEEALLGPAMDTVLDLMYDCEVDFNKGPVVKGFAKLNALLTLEALQHVGADWKCVCVKEFDEHKMAKEFLNKCWKEECYLNCEETKEQIRNTNKLSA